MARQFISLREILEKDTAHGGKEALILGKPGAGKTGLLLALASKLTGEEICIFRGLNSCQALRFPGHLNIIAYQCRPKFYDAHGNEIEFKVGKINSSYEDLLKACEVEKLNVVYFPHEKERNYWMAFSRFLVRRFQSKYQSNFVSLFIDEFEDIMPAPETGTAGHIRDFMASLKEFRKSKVSLYCATQQYFDLHWRGLGKINYRIYLRGAFVPKREARVDQAGVDSLPMGRGILAGSFFGFFTFPNYPSRETITARL